MPLVTVRDLSIRYRGPALLDGVSLQIEPGQRIGLLGRNGAGKTTLMRILCGEIEPDSGSVAFASGTTVSHLPQGVPQDLTGEVRQVVMQGLKADSHEPLWQAEQRVERVMAEMELSSSALFEQLSSGMKRRVLLARALACAPDLLLLDEPTNHLDIAAITWLEDFLSRWSATLMFVTHDRMFLRKLAGRIVEIDRGRLFDWSCDYDTFLVRKEGELAAEEKQNALFDKRLAEEEVWIRTGVKARRTRNEGRVRALEQMRRDRAERRGGNATARMAMQEGQRSGALVAEADGVSFAHGEQEIFRDFSISIMRGDKLGILGPNGAGKTTLLRVLLGELPPLAGTVRLGTNLKIAYFDQLRQQLQEDASVQQNVADGYDTVTINGRSRHVIGYLQDFLFSPERARTPVRLLSGGERNRVLLARLFAKPANVFVLDEPTNDLDAETLELLEDLLVEFDGTVLLVSHDRTFLNNVVTSTLVFDDGELQEFVGGYDDWLRQRGPRQAEPANQRTVTEPASRPATLPLGKTSADGSGAEGQRRLSFKQRQELTALPGLIEQLEGEIAALHDGMAQPQFYRQSGEQIARQQAHLKSLDDKLAAAYRRWETLEPGP